MFEKIFISPSGKFLLLLGLFLLFLGIASILQMFVILFFTDIYSLNDLTKIENILSDLSDPNIVLGMKIAQALSAILAFFVPSFLFVYFFSGENRTINSTFSFLRINKGLKIIFFPLIILLVFAVMPVINWTGELNSHFSLPDFMSQLENSMRESEDRLKEITEAFLQMNRIGDLLINLLVIALLSAVGEELFFRGVMQNMLAQWIKNIHIAIWLTAILFSALHFQFYGFLPRMFLGVVLGYLYVWSGSLWLPVTFHFLNNGFAVLFTYLIDKNFVSKNAETVGAGENEIMFVLASAVLSGVLMYFIWKQKEVRSEK